MLRFGFCRPKSEALKSLKLPTNPCQLDPFATTLQALSKPSTLPINGSEEVHQIIVVELHPMYEHIKPELLSAGYSSIGYTSNYVDDQLYHGMRMQRHMLAYPGSLPTHLWFPARKEHQQTTSEAIAIKPIVWPLDAWLHIKLFSILGSVHGSWYCHFVLGTRSIKLS